MDINNLKIRLYFLPLLSGLLMSVSTFAQVTQVQLLNADKLLGGINDLTDRLIGNVKFSHQDIILTCDSAWQYKKQNSLDAYGNVKIIQGDTLILYSDTLYYNGNTKYAQMRGNVRVVTPNMQLISTMLDYDLSSHIASYYTGATITSSANNNILTSDEGYYNSTSKMLSFKNNVLLNNPDYTMYGDTLLYYTINETARFTGPTVIRSDKNVIYCENGWYNTRNNQAWFYENSYLYTDQQKLSGDSLYYNRNLGIGKGIGHISLNDTINHFLITGDYGWTNEKTNESLVTGKALFTKYTSVDSLFLHADSIMTLENDSTKLRTVKAYHRVKFYKEDIQGKCDSLIWMQNDSTFYMYNEPVIWSEENQLTGELISVKTANGHIRSLFISNDAFVLSKVDSGDYFNQIKGKTLMGIFRNDSLYKIQINGNGESVYFAKKNDGAYLGMNKAICSDMLIYLIGNKISSISFITEPDATMYPMNQINPKDLRLKGIVWYNNNRPLQKNDVFIWTFSRSQ